MDVASALLALLWSLVSRSVRARRAFTSERAEVMRASLRSWRRAMRLAASARADSMCWSASSWATVSVSAASWFASLSLAAACWRSSSVASDASSMRSRERRASSRSATEPASAAASRSSYLRRVDTSRLITASTSAASYPRRRAIRKWCPSTDDEWIIPNTSWHSTLSDCLQSDPVFLFASVCGSIPEREKARKCSRCPSCLRPN